VKNGAAEYSCEPFGVLANGRAIDAILLTHKSGISVRVLTLGAALQSIIAPDRHGNRVDIALGYASAAGYLRNPDYFGVTLGRYANRIARGRFVLDGKTYQLATNDGPNALHGGIAGFSRALWTVEGIHRGESASVALSLVSPDGDDGYPGNLTVTATFELNYNQIVIDYRATASAPTIVNLSNHTYFNLGGEAGDDDILGHRLTIPADAFLPVDASLIPTGEIRGVGGTAFDFREATPIGRHIRNGGEEQLTVGNGYDHNWVLSRSRSTEPRLVAHVHHPPSGRVLEVLSTQPGLQLYTGNFLDGTSIGKSGRRYRRSQGMALEPQLFPDTPNRPAFGSARLAPGEVYENRIIYRLSAI
jgi:aldose 1-epimerase